MATEAELRLALERLIRQLELADFVNKDGLKYSTNLRLSRLSACSRSRFDRQSPASDGYDSASDTAS